MATRRWMFFALFVALAAIESAHAQAPRVTSALFGVDYTFERMTFTRVFNDRFDHGPVTLVAYVYRPLKNDRHEVVLVSLGSTGGQVIDPHEPFSSAMFLDGQLRTLLLRRGYTLVQVLRRGMGESGGTYAEECAYQAGKCTLAEARELGQPALDEALATTAAAVEQIVLARLKPHDGKVILYGGSRGGFLSLAFAAAHPERVRGVLAVSPGWMSVVDDWPGDENAARLAFHTSRLRRMGSSYKGPTLWIYAARDLRYADVITRQFFDAYRESGGAGEYFYIAEHTLPDGHQPPLSLWRPQAEQFFDSLEGNIAATPPMGWNSWDAYGESVSETDLRQSAKWMADNLKAYGWQYVVVDSGWYVTNHALGTNAKDAEFSLDAHGRYIPAVGTIPSAASGAGFKPLADYVHSLGLKFGIHVIRGIPKQAVEQNLPIAGSKFRAADAANTADTCPWNPFNYGLDATKPAAQAYYDSVARLYREWDVDFVKVDCIADHPYRGDEIRMLSEALRKTGRPIVLSLSPGPTALDKAAEVSRYSNMWRISDDIWDVWHSDANFPQGPHNQFARAAKWAEHSGPGHWPDADMLPIGSLRPSAGWGEPRESRLTRDEQRTLLTLWCMMRSPLVMGGNLLALDNDAWTKSLLTNAEVIAVDQHSNNSRAVVNEEKVAVWISQPDSGAGHYVAVFNLDDQPQSLRYSWKDLGLPAGRLRLRDLWEHQDLPSADSLTVSLPAHGSVLYRTE